MMEFRNDPQFDDLDPVGTGEGTLVAPRTSAGRAFRWEPGGDAEALVAFVGGSLLAVEGKVFFREPDGSLSPVNVTQPCVWVKPPAGEPFTVTKHEFWTQYAEVVLTAPLSATEVQDKLNSGEAVLAPLAGVAGEVEVAVHLSSPAADTPGDGATASASSPVVQAPRKPGRPKGSTNKPKAD
jgi:hypothetical protein